MTDKNENVREKFMITSLPAIYTTDLFFPIHFFFDFSFAHQLVFVRVFIDMHKQQSTKTQKSEMFLTIWIRNAVATNKIIIRMEAAANKNVKTKKENDNWEYRKWYFHVMLFSNLFYIRISIFFSLLFLMSYIGQKCEQCSFSVLCNCRFAALQLQKPIIRQQFVVRVLSGAKIIFFFFHFVWLLFESLLR